MLPPLADLVDAFRLTYGTVTDTVRRLCKLQCSDAFFSVCPCLIATKAVFPHEYWLQYALLFHGYLKNPKSVRSEAFPKNALNEWGLVFAETKIWLSRNHLIKGEPLYYKLPILFSKWTSTGLMKTFRVFFVTSDPANNPPSRSLATATNLFTE